jgi:ABC-type multidrug transport system fused ATPase/permease subunit
MALRSPVLGLRRAGLLFRRYLAPQAPAVGLLALLLLVGIGLQLFVPQILRRFIDAATGAAGTTADLSNLSALALTFLLVALGTQLLGGGATVLGAAVGWGATNLLRRDLLDHCLRLDMTFHANRTAGEMIERIDGDITALSDFFAQFLVRVVGGLLLLVGILVLLWWENPILGLALTLFTVAEVTVMVRLREVAVPATTRERESAAQLFGFVEEHLAGIQDLRANGGGAFALHRFYDVTRRFFHATREASMARSIVWLTSYGLFVSGMLVTIGSSIPLVMAGTITLGTAYMVFQYLLMLQAPIEQINQQLQVLQRAGASVGRIDELWQIGSRLAASDQGTLPPGALAVAFEGVSFRYHDADPASPPNLRQVTLALRAGEHLGLLGRTGSGKTTLTRLLVRFFDPDAGRVLLGGVDARRVPLPHLRRRVALVTQEVQLFAASVRDNLTFFDAGIPDERLRRALAEVGLAEWLASLPEGLDTPLRSAGGGLSAGEAQLLALARVFLDDPGLVILDEPSSRLDPHTEARLERALARLLHGRSAVIIAHRLETVARLDAIAVLADGELVEVGARAALARDPHSRYARLVATAAAGGSAAALPEELA